MWLIFATITVLLWGTSETSKSFNFITIAEFIMCNNYNTLYNLIKTRSWDSTNNSNRSNYNSYDSIINK